MKSDKTMADLAPVPKAVERTETVAFPSCRGLLIPGIPCKILESGIPGNVFAGMRLGVYFPGIPLTVLFYF